MGMATRDTVCRREAHTGKLLSYVYISAHSKIHAIDISDFDLCAIFRFLMA